MAENKPRIFQDGKDISMTLLVLLLIMLLSVGFTGLCSFNPGAPENGPVRAVDARQFLELEARAVKFPVRMPEVPEGWTANSARRTSVQQEPAPVIGWVTAEGAYLQLTQTGAPVDKAMKTMKEASDEADPVSVAGQSFRHFTPADGSGDDTWVADLGDVRFVIVGTAGSQEFEELATAAIRAEPIAVS
ncbi:DUF4245 domain-containing protein [Corynebacterium sp.]|uniref:DUF4245 domain-containing protein n=1 Tax=Corynebacterium sp. TaxID=1720 RepID=UPI0026DBCF3C|nr:DUF4245 domain-containing protein [Corynebacterium sp.]MDO5076424.1 DUF4245 domain-containing protein [Corynebacterium sp.]